ncbi:MAG: hypothetical protein HRT88_00375 [Lentisphaeraceae bacterium]|nr:hypothetical protein [Lentisphaeraceae bacterium]
MIHLFIATEFEAKPFIQGLHKVQDMPAVYEGETYAVIITGMGLVNSASASSAYLETLTKDTNHRLINIGIAGSGNSQLELAGVYQVSQFSMFCTSQIPANSRFVWDSSYPDIIEKKKNAYHLATSLHPLWNDREKSIVDQSSIDLIDMEGYSFAKACNDRDLSFEVYKGVSDYLSKSSQEDFLEKAQKAIDALFVYFTEKILHK